MASSDLNDQPEWMTKPFGPGWADVGRHVQTIMDVWGHPAWKGGAVSECSEAQLATLVATVEKAEALMRRSWPVAEWEAHQASTQGLALPDGATLSARIAHFEYRLVQDWQAQQVHAYWAHLSPAERARQKRDIQTSVSASLPLAQ